MIDIIEFKEGVYPKFQSQGFAAKFAFPFAEQVCKGMGVDVGCNRLEWMYASDHYEQTFYGGEGDFEGFKNMYEVCKNYYGGSIGAERPDLAAASFPIDPTINSFDAYNFPTEATELDYVFSSHCLEHLPNWVEALDYWTSKLRSGGVLFLYLPDYSQEYWRPYNNRKHIHCFEPKIIKDYLDSNFNYLRHKTFVSGVDLNNSFMVIAEKK